MRPKFRNASRLWVLFVSLLLAILGNSLFATSVAAQGLTDLGVHPPPTSGPYPYSPPGSWIPGSAGFPAQGTTYVDPVFGQTIRRLTNVYPNVGDSELYAKNGLWNADGTRIIHNSDANGTHDIIDTTTGAVVRGNIPWDGEPTFDPNFPDVFYYASGTTLQKLLLSTGTSVRVKDFEVSIAGYDNLGGTLNSVDNSGRYFLLNFNGTVRVWDAIDASGRLPGDPAYVSQATGLSGVLTGGFPASEFNTSNGYAGIAPDASGVISVYTDDTGNPLIWHTIDKVNKTLDSTGVNRGPNDGGDHGAMLWASDGNVYFVTLSNSPGWSVQRYNLTQGGPRVQLLQPGTNNSDEHLSCIPRGSLRDWCVIDLETGLSGNNDLASWDAFHQEIFMVNVLTPNTVRRLAHHRSQDTAQSYTWQPRVSVNWDGTQVAYLSNYGFLQNQYSDLWTVATVPGRRHHHGGRQDHLGPRLSNQAPSVRSETPKTGGAVLSISSKRRSRMAGAESSAWQDPR